MATSVAERPTTPQKSLSFTRLASPRPTPPNRSRASTLQNGGVRIPAHAELTTSPVEELPSKQDDIFDKPDLVNSEAGLKDVADTDSPHDIPDNFDDLPVELVSSIDRSVAVSIKMLGFSG